VIALPKRTSVISAVMSAIEGRLEHEPNRSLGSLELPQAVPAVLAFALRLHNAHRDDGIDSPTPRGPVLNADRPDLELAAIEREDDAVVVVGLSG